MSQNPDHWPGSIREINDLPQASKLEIYHTLIPYWVFQTFGIDPAEHTVDRERVIHVRCPVGSNAVEIAIYHVPDAPDPVLYLHMGDSFNSQLIVLMVAVNDPQAPRFNIDEDERGHPNQLGIHGRNLPEEVRAMQAGLAPGQIRRGLRIFRAAIPVFDDFVARMGHNLYLIEPLFYHNAITFERYGFAYARGLQKMKGLHRQFLPGGEIHAKLDGSTPFRQPDAWQTIRGRSWAIHDGILGHVFTGIQMYKRIGKDSGVTTFPDARW
jgi:hypothetical protein